MRGSKYRLIALNGSEEQREIIVDKGGKVFDSRNKEVELSVGFVSECKVKVDGVVYYYGRIGREEEVER